jgi:hypothetical protein
MYQLPFYSPDYNPIEYLWKQIKTKATHNRYFAEIGKLVLAVKKAFTEVDAQPQEILQLMGMYIKSPETAIFA